MKEKISAWCLPFAVNAMLNHSIVSMDLEYFETFECSGPHATHKYFSSPNLLPDLVSFSHCNSGPEED